jgi:V8-like Glu-specific endopeptidase
MSHVTGSVQKVLPPLVLGPDSGTPASSPNTWTHNFSHTPAADGTKLLMLHFRNADLPANNSLEVDLGYGTDVFTAADGIEFWTRPVNIHVLTGGLVPIRYITNGSSAGSVVLDKYGRGERHEEDPELATFPAFQSFSNCDPFLPGASYVEPQYATAWTCSGDPDWENIRCVTPPGDIRNTVASAVGMIVSVHGEHVSSCSVTLIEPNRIITAGHCVADPAEEIFTSSVTFDYAVRCNGTKPPGYNAVFHKVKTLIKFRNKTISGLYYDYCVLEIAVPPGGLGITPVAMRADLPAMGEQMFGIHHPNGAVKKLSQLHPGFATVLSSNSGSVRVNLDVSGGSSGSGLFDTTGRIVGVLSTGGPCSLNYFPTATIIPDLTAPPAPAATADVMIVFDRSGSMSMPAGTGRTKMEEARDAASLFVQLVRAATGNRVGLVSFSTTASSPVDFALSNVTNATKNTLIGPAPFSGGLIGALAPGGMTTIGGGLDAGRGQFPMPGANPRTIYTADGGDGGAESERHRCQCDWVR